jgi:hypothetical protein
MAGWVKMLIIHYQIVLAASIVYKIVEGGFFEQQKQNFFIAILLFYPLI